MTCCKSGPAQGPAARSTSTLYRGIKKIRLLKKGGSNKFEPSFREDQKNFDVGRLNSISTPHQSNYEHSLTRGTTISR